MTAGGDILGVNFASFENWWRERAGIIDPNIPVLPEFMVLRIADKVKAQRAWNTMLQPPPATNQSAAEGKVGAGGLAEGRGAHAVCGGWVCSSVWDGTTG